VHLNVSGITIRNVLGIESLQIKPGKVTVIRGRNGSGKSSIIEGIKSALKGGHDATLLRNGADKGETVILLNDGRSIGKSIYPTRSQAHVTGPAGTKTNETHSETIAQLVDALSVNPVDFLVPPKKSGPEAKQFRLSALLEAMPMKADLAKLEEITGEAVMPQLADVHALDAIEAVHKAIFEGRTRSNTLIRDKKGTIAQLEATIPAALADTDSLDENTLEDAIAKADEERDAELKRVDDKIAGMETEWENAIDAKHAEISKLENEIQAIKTDRETKRGLARKQRQKALDKCTAEKEPINSKINLIRANRDAAAKARSTRETVNTMYADLAKLEEDEQAATAALDGLKAYKASLLQSLPIPGLEVREGDIYYGEVLFDRLNTAQRAKIAVDIAKLRAGPLGFICVDGLELLDQEAFDAFVEEAKRAEAQLVVTRVDECDLTIDTL
jgi:DNA repair exonuclease SbcCD ATPase subunit